MVIQRIVLENQPYKYSSPVPSQRTYPLVLAYLAEEFPEEFCPKVLIAREFYQREGKRMAMPDEIAELSAVGCP
jgi:hypothetical protein